MLIRDQYLVLITAIMAENPSHKYDVAKRI